MRHIKYLPGGTAEFYDGRIQCTHVLIGQRNEALERPTKPEGAKPPTTAAGLPEEWVEWHKFKRKVTSGRFILCVLEWCEDEKEAEKLKKRFKEPEFINVRVEPISSTVGHA
jgi:hypothetical protein